MLWQTSQVVFDAMMAELIEANHPEHIRGNGPEQDYLSRYWADAPWTHLAVENNYQLHQMFFALHPDFVNSAERAKTIADPARIRVVHFSGEPGAKPWHRPLDAKFSHLWPDRGRDDEYVNIFAEEFHGYFLWVKPNRAAWDKVEESKKWGGHLSDFTLVDGKIYRVVQDQNGCTDGEEPEEDLVPADPPVSATEGAMKVLAHCLGAWFDAFEAAQKKLGLDLVAALAQASPGSKENLAEKQEQSWKPTWFAKPPAGVQTQVRRSGQRMQYQNEGGWMHERARRSDPSQGGSGDGSQKASITCGGRPGAGFVVFSEGDRCEPFFPDVGIELRGIFVKVVGRSPRSFLSSDCDLAPVRIWVSGVSVGEVVLIAIFGLENALLSEVLETLLPLGVPQGPVRTDCRALAAAGVVSNGGTYDWASAHASVDVAYASVAVPCAEQH